MHVFLVGPLVALPANHRVKPCAFGYVQATTTCMKGGTDPTWGETLTLPVTSSNPGELLVCLYNQNRAGKCPTADVDFVHERGWHGFYCMRQDTRTLQGCSDGIALHPAKLRLGSNAVCLRVSLTCA